MRKFGAFEICGMAILLAAFLFTGCGTGGSKTPSSSRGGGGGGSTAHSVDLSWGSSSAQVRNYYVYRSQQSGGPYDLLASLPPSPLSYTDSTVQSGLSYFYVVTVIDVNGVQSDPSNEASTGRIP